MTAATALTLTPDEADVIRTALRAQADYEYGELLDAERASIEAQRQGSRDIGARQDDVARIRAVLAVIESLRGRI